MRFTNERVAQLRVDIRKGFDAIDRGEYDDYDQHTTKQLAEDIKKRGRQRLADVEQEDRRSMRRYRLARPDRVRLCEPAREAGLGVGIEHRTY